MRWLRRALLVVSVTVAVGAALVSSAHAWTVTFEVYGGGKVFETHFPTTDWCGKTSALTANNALQDTCTTGDHYCGLCIYRFRQQPASGYSFVRWEWVTPGVACDDPAPSDGLPTDCQFQWAFGPLAGNYVIKAYFADQSQPAPTLTGPSGPIADPTPSFSWSTAVPVTSYRCRVDNTEFACGTSHTTSVLPDGAHSFSVRGTDHLANTGDWSTKTFTVDTTPPVTTITGVPADATYTKSRSASFQLVAPDAAFFTCHLNGTLKPCSAGPLNLADLPDGTYTLSVRATDSLANQENPPKTRTWTVDNAPPDTVITTGPAAGSATTVPAATFTFAGGDRFECRVDGAPFGQCSGGESHAVSGLAIGPHSFDVRAIDAAGNLDASPARRSWSVVPADVDRDGYVQVRTAGQPADCDDGNPGIHPGAVDVPGNGVDEDCSGGDTPARDADGDRIPDHRDRCPAVAHGAFDRDRDGCVGPYDVVRASLGGSWTATVDGIRVAVLRVKPVPAGATVEVLCPRRCGYAQTIRSRQGGTVRLGRLRGRLLRPGERFAVRVTRPGSIGQLHRVIVRRFPSTTAGLKKAAASPFKKRTRCLPAGSLRAARRCATRPAAGP